MQQPVRSVLFLSVFFLFKVSLAYYLSQTSLRSQMVSSPGEQSNRTLYYSLILQCRMRDRKTPLKYFIRTGPQVWHLMKPVQMTY
nr:PREDICTED: uncharacterized protein LOC106703942 isoform X2 [Latimeria chalumnae]|eukprot:XP_014345332.1 PREDICTED: uncharacterized protein LOC106703942 isoform X2 [Latimeria chalumnae]